MSRRLLDAGIRGRLMAADLASAVVARARGTRGQTTVEWLVLMVGIGFLITVLAGDQVWHSAGRAIVDSVRDIIGAEHDRV